MCVLSICILWNDFYPNQISLFSENKHFLGELQETKGRSFETTNESHNNDVIRILFYSFVLFSNDVVCSALGRKKKKSRQWGEAQTVSRPARSNPPWITAPWKFLVCIANTQLIIIYYIFSLYIRSILSRSNCFFRFSFFLVPMQMLLLPSLAQLGLTVKPIKEYNNDGD